MYGTRMYMYSYAQVQYLLPLVYLTVFFSCGGTIMCLLWFVWLHVTVYSNPGHQLHATCRRRRTQRRRRHRRRDSRRAGRSRCVSCFDDVTSGYATPSISYTFCGLNCMTVIVIHVPGYYGVKICNSVSLVVTSVFTCNALPDISGCYHKHYTAGDVNLTLSACKYLLANRHKTAHITYTDLQYDSNVNMYMYNMHVRTFRFSHHATGSYMYVHVYMQSSIKANVLYIAMHI